MKKIGKVSSLFRYPVKSMQGEKLHESIITNDGLLGDRYYALIDTKTKKIVSAKNPKKWPNIFLYKSRFLTEPSIDNIPDVEIQLKNKSFISSLEDNINHVLSDEFNSNIILSKCIKGKSKIEGLFDDSIEDVIMPENTFFDIGKIHIITTSTISKLKEVYEEGNFNSRRFRPNIIIDTDEKILDFVENKWVNKKIYIGKEVILYVKQKTSRCIMTTLEQNNIQNDINILKMIKKYNKGTAGVYVDVIQNGIIKINDPIYIEEE